MTKIQEHADNLSEGVAIAGAKLAPPATVSVLTYMGIPLSEWILVLTCIYTVLMIVNIAIKTYYLVKGKKHANDES